LRAVSSGSGTFDVLLWGAFQFGRWSTLQHRAFAYALEGGWQPVALTRLKPWFRAGWDRTSGDSNPKDGIHGTFFPFLLGPRPYARVPFFAQMNLSDAFAEIILRPAKTVEVHSDLHQLWLTNGNDLWYQGAGAYQRTTFGFSGRASQGERDLGRLYDVSVEITPTSKTTLGFYVGVVSGGSVIRASYPAGQQAHFGYVEVSRKF
jgi:hypothetical protein